MFASVCAFIIAASYLLSPNVRFFTVCPFRLLTTLPCPSCGMTRAFIALAHGQLLAAMHYNVASPFLFSATIVIGLLGAIQSWRDADYLARLWRAGKRLLISLVLLLMAIAWIGNLSRRFFD